jgi:hypothetical protein
VSARQRTDFGLDGASHGGGHSLIGSGNVRYRHAGRSAEAARNLPEAGCNSFRNYVGVSLMETHLGEPSVTSRPLRYRQEADASAARPKLFTTARSVINFYRKSDLNFSRRCRSGFPRQLVDSPVQIAPTVNKPPGTRDLPTILWPRSRMI